MTEYKLVIDFALLVLIWMVQLLIYPGFEYLAPMTFHKWHKRYAGSMTLVVAPLMFMQTGLAGYLLYTNPDRFTVIHAVLVALTWVTTIFIFIPIHHQLDHRTHDVNLCKKLVDLNWARVILWTMIVVIHFIQILLRS
ncbi:MAG: hypothetical protein WBA16_04940 [Nonlabens sp.]